MTELRGLLATVLETAARDAALKAAARRFGADYAEQIGTVRTVHALQSLLDTAKADGELHPDITIDDFAMLLATAPLDEPAPTRQRWLTLVLPGLTATGRPAS